MEYDTYAEALAAAKAAVTENKDGSFSFNLLSAYKTRAEAEAAAAATVTKQPYDAMQCVFTNKRETGTLQITKDTVNDVGGTFTFHAVLGATVTGDDVTGADITAIYPKGMTEPSTLPVGSVETHADYRAYTTALGTYKIYRDGKVTRQAPGTDSEITLAILCASYPDSFTTKDGMRYAFVTTSDENTSTTVLTIDTTVYEFRLTKNDGDETDPTVTITLPYGAAYIVDEVTPAGWELKSVSNDADNDESANGSMLTTGTIEHVFLNDFTAHSLTIGKTVEGNQASRDKYFKYEITIETDGVRTLHLDMSDATKAFSGNLTDAPNAATSYTMWDIQSANAYDAEPNLTYANATSEQQHICEWTDGEYTYLWSDEDNHYVRTSIATGETAEDDITVPANATRSLAKGQHIRTNADGSVTFTIYLQHGETATLSGIPWGSSYTVTELCEGYHASAALTGDTYTGELRQEDGSMSSGTELTAATVRTTSITVTDSCLQEDTTVMFTNTRSSVIPTEIFFDRWAAPALLAAAGVYALCRGRLMRRRRKGNA